VTPRLTPLAARELDTATAHIAAGNPAAAVAFREAVLAAARQLTLRPAIGSRRPYLPTQYRFWPLPRFHYLLVYDASEEPIRILRVVHMSRDLPRVLASLAG
jgi:toxin ParE1/3/4